MRQAELIGVNFSLLESFAWFKVTWNSCHAMIEWFKMMSLVIVIIKALKLKTKFRYFINYFKEKHIIITMAHFSWLLNYLQRFSLVLLDEGRIIYHPFIFYYLMHHQMVSPFWESSPLSYFCFPSNQIRCD